MDAPHEINNMVSFLLSTDISLCGGYYHNYMHIWESYRTSGRACHVQICRQKFTSSRSFNFLARSERGVGFIIHGDVHEVPEDVLLVYDVHC